MRETLLMISKETGGRCLLRGVQRSDPVPGAVGLPEDDAPRRTEEDL